MVDWGERHQARMPVMRPVPRALHRWAVVGIVAAFSLGMYFESRFGNRTWAGESLGQLWLAAAMWYTSFRWTPEDVPLRAAARRSMAGAAAGALIVAGCAFLLTR